jgi:mercuric ion binding protein
MIDLKILALSLALSACPALAVAQQGPAGTAQPVRTVTLAVKGMFCGLCSPTVKKALSKVPGVIEAKVDFETQTAVVTFDSAKTDIAALTKATTNAGFPSAVKP